MSLKPAAPPVPDVTAPHTHIWVVDWHRHEAIGRICVECGQKEPLPGAQAARPKPDVTAVLLAALKGLYALVPDNDGDYLLDGAKGEFALKAIRAPGIGEACQKARAAIQQAEATPDTP